MGRAIRDGSSAFAQREMRIAVSGATGFIGRHVLAELALRDVDVVAISRAAPAPRERLRWVQMDVNSPPVDAFEQLGRPDGLIHLAWGGLPNYRALHHFEREAPDHYRFLSQVIKQGLSSLVVAGTCFEYGMQSGLLTESMDVKPDNPYGFAKDTLRRELEYLRRGHPFSFAWGRLFYLYGEGQAESSLLPLLRKAVASGEKVFNMSGGEQIRDYLSVVEAAKAFVSLAVGKSDAGVLNICAGKPVSVRRFVEQAVSENGWDIELNLGFYGYPDYEPFAFWGDRSKLEAVLAQITSGA
jgi:nucleoside-diphosphate-sugar epimerase